MDAEVEEDHQEPQEVEDREVEYAGPSARDYGEPALLLCVRFAGLPMLIAAPRRRALHPRLPRAGLQVCRLWCGSQVDAARRHGGPGGLGP